MKNLVQLKDIVTDCGAVTYEHVKMQIMATPQPQNEKLISSQFSPERQAQKLSTIAEENLVNLKQMNPSMSSPK